MSKNKNTLLNWLYQSVLFVAIVGITVLFVHYGMSLFYPAPTYGDFCYQRPTVPSEEISDKPACEAVGGQWQSQSTPLPTPKSSQTTGTTSTTTTESGFCNRDHDCRQAYEAAQRVHDRTGFAILASIGVLLAAVGLYGCSGSVLFVSLAAAGILTVLTAIARFWSNAGDWLQFGVLGLVLAVFILIAYRKDRHE